VNLIAPVELSEQSRGSFVFRLVPAFGAAAFVIQEFAIPAPAGLDEKT
jgi:hypothetical protein